MSRTFQPVLFVTTNPEYANEFSKLENLDSSFIEILKRIPHDNTVLLSPLKNKQYFQSFDYNVGYDRSEMFSINLQFVDIDQSFEDIFLKFIFNDEKYRHLVKETFVERKIAKIDSLSKEKSFNTVELILQNKFQGFTYFVFGINDRCTSPIISQFRRCEVTQTSEGAKKIKINFQNLGHPYLLSDLAQLNIAALESKSEAIQVYNNASYIVREAYTVSEKDPDLIRLVTQKGLDKFIKGMLKKLFIKITGGLDVLLLLPDFDKLYARFKATYKPSSRFLAVQQYQNLTRSQQFLMIADFFRLLGFNIYSDIYKKLKEKDEAVSEEAKQKAEKFSNDLPNIKRDLEKINIDPEIIKQLLTTNQSSRNEILDRIFKDKERQIIKEENYRTTKQSIDKLRQLKTLKTKITERLDALYKNLNDYILGIAQAEGGVTENLYTFVKDTIFFGLLQDSELEAEYAKIITERIDEDLKELIINERFGDKQIDYEDPSVIDKIDDKPPFLEFSIAQEKNGDFSPEVLPVKRNAVNLYKFFAEFSTSIAKILSEFDVRIGCFEENDITRLRILHQNCEDYFGKFITSESDIYDKPLIIIADEFILKNLFYPVTTTKPTWGDYPVSDFDVRVFGPESDYFSVLNEFRKKFIKKTNFLNSSFNESLASDALDILNKEDNKALLETLTIPNIPVFVGNHSRGNITSYTSEVDKQNHFAAYRALIAYTKNSIITESLRPVRRSIYDKLIDYDKFKEIAVTYFSEGNINIETLKEKIAESLAPDPESPEYLRFAPKTKEYFTRGVIDASEEFVNYLVDDILFDILSNTRVGVSHTIETDIRLNLLTKKKVLLQELYKKLFKLSIKTLPFFDICNLERLYSGAFVILKNFKPSVPNFKSIEEYNYLTGFYFIRAYKHVITPTSCYSEFSLIKSIDVGGIEV